MSKTGLSESKAPLIIALVFFSLTSLVLGTLLYTSQNQIAVAEARAKKADEDRKDWEKKVTQEKDKLLVCHAIIGILQNDDLEILKATKSREARNEYEAILGSVSKRMNALHQNDGNNVKTLAADDMVQWTWKNRDRAPESGPQKSLLDALAASYAQQQIAVARAESAIASMRSSQKNYEENAKKTLEVASKFSQAGREYPKQVRDVQRKADIAIAIEQEKVKSFTKDYNQSLEEIKTSELRDKAALESARKEKEAQARLIEQYQAEREKNIDMLVPDNPLGKITVRRGNIVFIDLGSADYVRVGLTFRVQASDTAERGLQTRTRPMLQNGKPAFNAEGRQIMEIVPKAMIEVQEVDGPHSSIARITSETDPIRESAMSGDVLYNPVWRKGNADHIALVGMFVGINGTDDIQGIRKSLEKVGVIVDAYFDLGTRKWVGEITKQTTYVVEGQYPVATGDSSSSEFIGRITHDMDKAISDAKTKGASKIKYREFFPRIGYSFRIDITPEIINGAFARYLPTVRIPTGTEDDKKP